MSAMRSAALVVSGAATLALTVVLVVLWGGVLSSRSLRRRAASLLCVASQVLVTAYACVLAWQGSIGYVYVVGTGLCGFACAALDLSLFGVLQADEEAQVAAERSRMLADQVEAQREHVRMLRETRRSWSGMRSEMARTFRRTADALAAGNREEAVRLLGAGEQAAAPVRAMPCAHPVVGALLCAKEELCRERGVTWECSVRLPAVLGMSGVDACMLFSSLVDNAIGGALTSGSPEPYVRVKARVAHGFLVVEVQNSCAEVAAQAPLAVSGEPGVPEHGWGRRILASLVDAHDGDLSATVKDGTYRVSVLVRLDEDC